MKFISQNMVIPIVLGIMFSIGLSMSGMVNPNIVKNFLDVFGTWDPRLLYVMGGAVLINIYPFYKLKKHGKTIFGKNIEFPKNNIIDKKLVIGAGIFGVGWGITGICPGPAVANLFLLDLNLYVFFIAMLIGMLAFKWFFDN